MIVLSGIDLAAGTAEFHVRGRVAPNWERELPRILKAARDAQLKRVSVLAHDGTVRKETILPDPSATSDGRAATDTATVVHLIEHLCTLENGRPVYFGSFRHTPECLVQLSRYAGLLLATFGHQKNHLMQLRLAIYEICANVIEHGLRYPGPGRLEIHLHFMPNVIEGWVQDQCERFDLSRVVAAPASKQARQRSSRGYGIAIIRQLLDSIGHEFNQMGNRITFTKRILQ